MFSPVNSQRKRATSLQIDSQLQHDGEQDFVPDHLVSPFILQTRLKSKGHLQRVFNEDLVDMGIVPPAKQHPALASRRQSDPGRISPARHNRYGGSCSSSDDEDYERSPRSHSPKHFVGTVPEEDSYTVSGMEGRLSPGLSSPRRRLVHQRHSTTVGDEATFRMRPNKVFRSNSLPGSFLPSEIGEAVGALAKGKGSNDTANKRSRGQETTKSGSTGTSVLSGTQVSSLKRTHINRCVSIEEPLLESILEENGARVPPRRLSVPHCFSADSYTTALP